MVKVIFQCTWVAYSVETFFDITDTSVIEELVGYSRYPKELIDCYLFCGPGLAAAAGDVLYRQRKTDNKDKIMSFGYLPYEDKKTSYMNTLGKSPECAVIHDKRSRYKKAVMFITGGMEYPKTLVEELRYLPKRSQKKQFLDRSKVRVEVLNYYAENYVGAILTIASRNPELMVIVKRHPADESDDHVGEKSRFERLRQYSNIFFVEGSDNAEDYFDIIDCMVHYGSTLSMLSYIWGIYTIGIKNTHRKCHAVEVGKSGLYGNDIVNVGEVDVLENKILNMNTFTRDEKTEEALYNLMGYSYEENYQPSQKLIQILEQLPPPQRIYGKSNEVREQLFFKSCIKKYTSYFVDLLRFAVLRDRGRVKAIGHIFSSILR